MRENTVRVHFIDGHTAIVPAKNIRSVGDEGARSGTALVDGREIPIYNRVEWGFLWEEQQEREEYEEGASYYEPPYNELGEEREA